MKDLITLVHGNSMGMQRIVRTFRETWGRRRLQENPSLQLIQGERECKENSDFANLSGISKRKLEEKIATISSKEYRSGDVVQRYYVNRSFLEKYGLGDIVVSSQTNHVGNSTFPSTAKPVPEEGRNS